MKISSNLFKSFIEKATLNGTISSMVIDVDEKGFKSQQKDLSNVALTVATLSSKGEVMQLCIKDTNLLLNMLKGFEGDVEIKKDNNIMSIFNTERQVDIVLSTPEYIDCNLTKIPESLENAFDKGVSLTIAPFKNIVGDMTIVKSSSIILEVKDKILELKTGDKDFDNIKIKTKADYNNAKAEYCELLARVINVIDGKFNLSFKDKFPLQIIEEDKGIKVRYIVAPLVDKE